MPNFIKPVDLLFKAAAVVALCLSSFLHFTQHPLKIAYVDSTRLLSDYQGMVDARRDYYHQQQEWKRNLDTLKAETTRSLLDYRKKQLALAPAQRQETEIELRVRQQQVINYQRAIQGRDNEAQEKLTHVVVDSTNAFLKRYGKQHDYDLVLLTSEGDNIAYSKDGFDITTPVLKELNDKYSKSK